MKRLLLIQEKLHSFFKTIGTLLLLLLAFPFNFLLVSTALLLMLIRRPFQKKAVAENPKTILLTGGKMTKALQLARSFSEAGHRVILVEAHKYWLSGHRYSNAIFKFYTVPAPEKDPPGYCQTLLEIVKKESVDVFIAVSSPVASYYDSLAKPILSPYCEVLHFDPEMTQMLDNKFSLCEKARFLGLTAPKVYLITDPQQILDFNFTDEGYILKSIRYNSVSRLEMPKLPFAGMEDYVKKLAISKDNPWVMQAFISGQEYCTHSTVRQGKIRLHCCSESSPFQVNYAQVDNPAIFQWVKHFVEPLKLTGQISFDFIQTQDGTVYPIECNPRTHSAITMFYDHPGVAEAYLTDAQSDDEAPITPLSNSKPTFWLYHELWRLTQVRSLADWQKWVVTIRQGTDAIFRWNDPIPFLAVHHWQIPLLLLDNLRKLRGWLRIDFNIGKLVEMGGD